MIALVIGFVAKRFLGGNSLLASIATYAVLALIASGVFFGYGEWQYRSGLSDGKSIERSASLAHAMDVIKERGDTNAEVNGLSDAALCRELGGEWVLADLRCQ